MSAVPRQSACKCGSLECGPVRCRFDDTSRGSTFREQARDSLADDLLFGKTVDRCTLKDLIECDLDQRFDFASKEVAGLLVAEEPDRSLYISRFHDRIIKEYLDTKDDVIEERAVEMAQGYMEDQAA